MERSPAAPVADVFVSYNHADRAAVQEISAALSLRGLTTFADWKDLEAGLPWPSKLERSLSAVRAVAIILGPSGLGPWQSREMYYALDAQLESQDAFPVFAVLLAGAEPPSGFLKLNTWVDLRRGISDESIEQLVRAVRREAVEERPVSSICPYRDLRSFGEEDAPLFFGREEAIDKLLQRIDASTRLLDAPRLVAVVGPSGSGKSSVVAAGVVPALRRRHPPEVVWDAVTFKPDQTPWRGLADALAPLLLPNGSIAEQSHEATTLMPALQSDGGIASIVKRILKESAGTGHLLIVVDQFEELFTAVDEKTARAFVAALLAASRNAPMTIVVTLRSDYYGRAIALDRDLSNALAEAQVNLGPIRRDELRDVIEKPARIVGLTFAPGLVDRILNDVGDEPGNLPLLEYALTELWKNRTGRELTFAVYDQIGGVTSALAKRADTLFHELPARQQPAARRLFTRLVRVSAANEEGADTRRRVRREELDDDAWSLVRIFTGPSARLLVAGTDTVEVAHEALIQKWTTLRTWIEEDRRFLLWRQQLDVYRATDPDGVLMRDARLAEAQSFLRERRDELSADEREYLDVASAKVRSRRRKIYTASALGVAAAMVVLAWMIWVRTASYAVRQILARSPAKYVVASSHQPVYDMAALIRCGALRDLEDAVHDEDLRAERLAEFAMASRMAGLPASDVDRAIVQADDVAKAEGVVSTVRVASIYRAYGGNREARALLAVAERAAGVSHDALAVASAYYEAGHAVDALRTAARYVAAVPSREIASTPDEIEILLQEATRLIRYGRRETAADLMWRISLQLRELQPDSSVSVATNLHALSIATGHPLPYQRHLTWPVQSEAGRSAYDRLLRGDIGDALATYRRLDSLERSGAARAFVVVLIRGNHLREAEAIAAESDANSLPRIVTKYLESNRRNEAYALVRRIEATPAVDRRHVVVGFSDVSIAFRYAGNEAESERAYNDASRVATTPKVLKDDAAREVSQAALTKALAARGRFHEARKIADAIENDTVRWDAQLAILREYAGIHAPRNVESPSF
jgi:KaiC/GvpD/RAD55 family RecA-like ATPase